MFPLDSHSMPWNELFLSADLVNPWETTKSELFWHIRKERSNKGRRGLHRQVSTRTRTGPLIASRCPASTRSSWSATASPSGTSSTSFAAGKSLGSRDALVIFNTLYSIGYIVIGYMANTPVRSSGFLYNKKCLDIWSIAYLANFCWTKPWAICPIYCPIIFYY